MRKTRVRITENFERNLEGVRAFLVENEASAAFEGLLDAIFDRLIPNLEQHPRIGRDFMSRSPQSAKGRSLRKRVTALLGRAAELREYILDDYIVLYGIDGAELAVLAIKHHRQLSFDLPRFWT